jgi:hypothetical protein
VRRAVLPEILFTPDLALALGGITPSAARRAVLRGDCGPYLRIGRRIAVRRESLLAALAEREMGAALEPDEGEPEAPRRFRRGDLMQGPFHEGTRPAKPGTQASRGIDASLLRGHFRLPSKYYLESRISPLRIAQRGQS